MTDNTNAGQKPKGGIGWGIFLLLAGFVLLAEQLKWLPEGSRWLFPVIPIAWGQANFTAG